MENVLNYFLKAVDDPAQPAKPQIHNHTRPRRSIS